MAKMSRFVTSKTSSISRQARGISLFAWLQAAPATRCSSWMIRRSPSRSGLFTGNMSRGEDWGWRDLVLHLRLSHVHGTLSNHLSHRTPVVYHPFTDQYFRDDPPGLVAKDVCTGA